MVNRARWVSVLCLFSCVKGPGPLDLSKASPAVVDAHNEVQQKSAAACDQQSSCLSGRSAIVSARCTEDHNALLDRSWHTFEEDRQTINCLWALEDYFACKEAAPCAVIQRSLNGFDALCEDIYQNAQALCPPTKSALPPS